MDLFEALSLMILRRKNTFFRCIELFRVFHNKENLLPNKKIRKKLTQELKML